MKRWLGVWGLLAALAGGCDDAASGGGDDETPDSAVAPDAGPQGGPDGAAADPDGAVADPDAAAVPDAAPVEPDAAPPMAAWVVVTLDPRRPLYELDDAVTAQAEAFDVHGQPIPDPKISWSVEPRGIAEIDPAGALQFRAEGQGFAVACIAGDVCGRAAFYVDAAPPALVVDEPARGAVLGGENSRTIRVRGTAGDGGGHVTVHVNGLPVDLDAEGRFALDLEASFGLNRVEVTADDGVRRPPVREVREVLWAPSWLRADEGGATIPAAMELRIEQALLDRDTPVALPAGAGAVVIDELAQIIGALLSLADPSALLGDLTFGDDESLTLRASGVRLGAVDVDLYLTADGMELFARLPDAEIDTVGHVDLEGERIGLDGTLGASLATFARMRIDLDGGLRVEVQDVSVAVEGLVGRFADPAADALIGTFGSRLREAAEGLAGGSVGDLIREGLPPVIEDALGSLVESLGDVPIELDPNIEGVPPVTLRLSLTPSTLALRRRDSMRMALDARIAQGAPVASPHPDPGVPVLSEAPLARGPGGGLTGGLRLALINGILHEVWRAGLLRLAPPLPEELAGALGSVQLDGVLPPVVAPGPRGSEHPLELQIGELRLEARQMGAEAADVYAIGIRAGLSVRVVEGQFELALSADPDVRAELVAQAGARPVLPPNALAQLLEAVIWPQLQDSLAGGLALGLDPIDVDPEDLQALAPRLAGLTLTPRFVEDPALEGGHVVLEGGLEARLDLAAP